MYKKSKAKDTRRMSYSAYRKTLRKMLELCKVPLKRRLSQQECNTIWNMRITLYDATGNYQQIYEDCHKLVNTTLSNHNYQPRVPGKPRHPNAMEHLPYEIKNLIYTMAYKAVELYDKAPSATKKIVKKPSQKGILDYISTPLTASNGQCCKLSLKTFTQFGISPKIFYAINNYKQITLPSTYPGAKVRYLGYALNHLVAYAGTVDNYVDLFGGSASAYMAVTKTNNVDYYINEFDFFVINYYKVIIDDTLYKNYIRELCKVRNKLRPHIAAGTAVTESKSFLKHCEKVEKQWRSKYPGSNYDQLVNGAIQKSANWQLYASESPNEKIDAAVAYTYIYSFTGAGGSPSSGAINNSSIKKFCNFDVKEYDKFRAHMKRLKEVYNSDMLTDNEFLIDYFTDKAPVKFQTVEATAKSMRNGSTPDLSDEAKKLLRLLGKDSNGRPRNFRTLFYSDSPYLATTGYKSGGINKRQMKDLIKKLTTASQNGSHFIFSCRASKTIEHHNYYKFLTLIDLKKPDRTNGDIVLDTETVYNYDYIYKSIYNGHLEERVGFDQKPSMEKVCELLSQNNNIYQYIFKEFENHSENYYVLACYEINGFKKTRDGIENANIDIMLKTLMTVEVFITDYDFVCPLDFTDDNKKIFRFKKYTISQFCDLLDNNMFKSSKTYEVFPHFASGISGYKFH